MLADQAPKDQFRQEFRVKEGVMHLRLAGRLPNEVLHGELNVFTPLINLCEESQCQQVVIDSRDLEVDLDTLEIFRAGVDASDLTRHGLRIALVARQEMMSSFFDDVIHNRAAPVRVFTDPDAAATWLRENG
jgi:hypothetical protein